MQPIARNFGFRISDFRKRLGKRPAFTGGAWHPLAAAPPRDTSTEAGSETGRAAGAAGAGRRARKRFMAQSGRDDDDDAAAGPAVRADCSSLRRGGARRWHRLSGGDDPLRHGHRGHAFHRVGPQHCRDRRCAAALRRRRPPPDRHPAAVPDPRDPRRLCRRPHHSPAPPFLVSARHRSGGGRGSDAEIGHQYRSADPPPPRCGCWQWRSPPASPSAWPPAS